MKCISVVCVLSAFLAISLAAPAPADETNLVPVHNQVKRQTDNSNSAALNRIISFSNNKIQLLRRMCPQLFQIIDNVIQNVTSQVFRVVGGALLRSGGLGGGGGGDSSGGGGGGRVSVVLPTFPPDEDEDDDDDEDEDNDDILNIQNRINATSTESSEPNALSLPSKLNEIDDNANMVSSNTTETDNSIGVSTTVVNLETFMSPSASASRSARKVREANDQEASASGGNGPNPAEDLADTEAEESDRNKRFLPFGGDGQGSAGGSGNFLFDLIRNTADRAARAAGTVYRMVAGTENIGIGISARATSTQTLGTASQLVAGSGTTEETEEKTAGVGGVAEIDVSPKGTGEGIPGPITRLLVVANRGIANLIQDLILRLAQTSERIVNFKARLVTALI